MPNFTDVIKTIDNGLRGGINTALDFVVPHARKEPLNPMAYVRDVNEWFAPAAQMALDELEGRESYPSWAYVLSSAPVVGKVAKPLAKAATRMPKVSEIIAAGKPINGVAFKELDNDVTKAAVERIKEIETANREFEKVNRTSYRADKYGNPIGNGTWHSNYPVYDIPGAEVSISPSLSTESVYVTYRMPNGKTSQARYSTHHSNTEIKDLEDILYDLGIVRSEPSTTTRLSGRNVRKGELKALPSSGKTYTELLALPDEELLKYEGMLPVDNHGNKQGWVLDGKKYTAQDDRRLNYFVKDEYKDLFKDY